MYKKNKNLNIKVIVSLLFQDSIFEQSETFKTWIKLFNSQDFGVKYN